MITQNSAQCVLSLKVLEVYACQMRSSISVLKFGLQISCLGKEVLEGKMMSLYS